MVSVVENERMIMQLIVLELAVLRCALFNILIIIFTCVGIHILLSAPMDHGQYCWHWLCCVVRCLIYHSVDLFFVGG